MQQREVLKVWRCRILWKAAPHHCSHIQSTQFSSPLASRSSQRHKVHFSHGRFLRSLVLQRELVSHSPHSKNSTLSSPCTSGSTAWCPHHPSSQWIQPGFRLQGNSCQVCCQGARFHEVDKIRAMPFVYCFQVDRFPISCDGVFFLQQALSMCLCAVQRVQALNFRFLLLFQGPVG